MIRKKAPIRGNQKLHRTQLSKKNPAREMAEIKLKIIHDYTSIAIKFAFSSWLLLTAGSIASNNFTINHILNLFSSSLIKASIFLIVFYLFLKILLNADTYFNYIKKYSSRHYRSKDFKSLFHLFFSEFFILYFLFILYGAYSSIGVEPKPEKWLDTISCELALSNPNAIDQTYLDSAIAYCDSAYPLGTRQEVLKELWNSNANPD